MREMKRQANAASTTMLEETPKRARLTPDERLLLCQRIRALTPKGVKQTDSILLIREMRDR